VPPRVCERSLEHLSQRRGRQPPTEPQRGAIETMRELDLAAKARAIGDTMLPRLRALQERTGVIGDVRGRGAMIAVEIVRPGTKEPDKELTRRIAGACHAHGVVVLTADTFGNVLRFLPPLVIGQDLLTEALDVLDSVVAEAAPR
jgi:4-aminobutyrate aminotransferase/(S)-3-amino-2-methylpropionate transaminase